MDTVGEGGSGLTDVSSRFEDEHAESDPCRRCDREQTGQRRFEHGDEL